MTAKIKEDLITCLQSFKGVSPKNQVEFSKVLTTLKRPDVNIPNDKENKQKIRYLLGLLFYQMPELIRPENEKPLSFFTSKAKLITEPLTKKPTKRT